MARKNLRKLSEGLSQVAAEYPSQHVETASAPQTQAAHEPTVQFAFGLRKSLRKELQRMAADADMTMRAFLLSALKEKGLSVTDEDLLDLRRKG